MLEGQLERFIELAGPLNERARNLKPVRLVEPHFLTLPPRTIKMNAACFIFSCAGCREVIGFSGEDCDLVTCTTCKRQTNLVTGEKDHTYYLRGLFNYLINVRADDRNDQLEASLRRFPEAAKACSFDWIQGEIRSGHDISDVVDHIATYNGELGGFAVSGQSEFRAPLTRQI